MSKVILVIPPERFRDEELFETQEVLEDAGHRCSIASTKTGLCPGSRGGMARAEIELIEVRVADYHAIVFVGGGGTKLLFNNEETIALARRAYELGKVVAAICLAPVILAKAGVLKGHRATVAGTEAKTITALGATYTGPGVTVDRSIVTVNGPKASSKFAQEICNLLAAGRQKRTAAQQSS